ncbi:MAG TPA: hypothetical protein VFC78_00190 [Tepidisphaeraceae bacterium]|nr:hypothetical protein [Tepidisphaeraceae bacterium]
MSDVIDLPLEDDDRLYATPLVDLLYYDEERCAYFVTFVPSDEVSHESTEISVVQDSSPEFVQLDALFGRLEELVGSNQHIVRVVHQGGGNFAVHLLGGAVKEFMDTESNSVGHEVSDRLKQIANVAEIAFRLARCP